MKTVWKVAILVLLVGAAIGSLQNPKELTDEQRATNERRSREYTAVSFAKTIVPKQLRDPASAQFGDVNAYIDRKYKGKPVTAVCGSVNAKNAFGGYTGMKEFVMIAETSAVVFNNDKDNSVFVNLWNTLCSGKHS